MKILALIPAHNEAPRVGAVIAAACQHLPVLVVDDGSTDETSAVARAAGAEVLRQEPNQGKGKALKAGFRHALAAGYDAILTLDADGQHDPAEIPAFLASFGAHHSDLIIGARDFARMPFSRRFANTSGRLLFSWAMRQTIHDNQSGYRLLSARLAEASLESPIGGFEFEVDMLVICVNRGWRLDWVTIQTIYGVGKSHISPVRHIGRFLRMVWRTRRTVHPHSTQEETL